MRFYRGRRTFHALVQDIGEIGGSLMSGRHVAWRSGGCPPRSRPIGGRMYTDSSRESTAPFIEGRPMAATVPGPTTSTSAVIVNTAGSPYAAHRPVPVGNVRFREGVLASRAWTNLRESIPTQFAELDRDGHLRNLERAAGRRDDAFEGRYYNDSDTWKWLEAACWALAG